MKKLFDQLSTRCSRTTTHLYSTSFSIGVFCLHPRLRDPICALYGFVRLADEIVDSFHQYDKSNLLSRFRKDTDVALKERISLNPILNSFQAAVHAFGIEREHIDTFLRSMEMDLHRHRHNDATFREYVVGSAEVVGLMCLRIFTEGDDELYSRLKHPAMRLGAAFQKINFLRDLRADMRDLGRTYFPGMALMGLNENEKVSIEQDIREDLQVALSGLRQLPRSARFGVYVAYMYYLALFRKIRNTPAKRVLQTRVRIANAHKASLLALSYIRHRLNLL
jgi:phytoene synthase